MACAFLLLVVLATFGRLLGAGFLSYDDPQYVLNAHVLHGLTWDNLRWAFTEAHYANWHPVTWLSHMADVALFGAAPGWHHLTSVVLHGLNAMLLLLLLEDTTKAFWPSLATAMLFAIHPLHVESVAWIAERKDVLSMFFALLTLMAYVRYTRSRSRVWLAGTLLLYALGLMAKPMLVSLPILMICLDHWPLGRTCRPWGRSMARLVWEKGPFLLMAAAVCVITVVSQAGSRVTSTESPFGHNLLNALASYGRYLGMTLLPMDLAAFYPALPPGRLAWLAAVSLAALVVLTWAALRQAWERPYLLAGWAWFLVALVPVAGFLPVGAQSIADRYTYLPLVGVFAALSWLGSDVLRRWRVPRGLAAALLGLLAAAGMARSWVEAGYWKDDRTLFTRDLAVVGNNAVAHLCLGLGWYRDGAREEAVREFRETVALVPGHGLAWYWMGEALLGLGREDEARQAFGAVWSLEPENYRAILRLGPILMRQGRYGEAIAPLRAYIALEPRRLEQEPDARAQKVGTREARRMLGLILRQLARPEEACAELQAAVQADPQEPGLLLNLGLALREAGRRQDALEQFRRCVALAPASSAAHLEFGRELGLAGRVQEAAREIQVARSLGARE
ncbi:tetratricopeptide repeat protein [Geothrix sp. 21YS21S-2]|uniref:tetratricopeptide repeat protein n=1 Tax=Geothrix sp. 21YS21S-2 TaxID=3068893 RepID=UPI0027B89FAA|nr:tetratricopeptide repeat protein [Geothrix sp. 21YS21S-2]